MIWLTNPEVRQELLSERPHNMVKGCDAEPDKEQGCAFFPTRAGYYIRLVCVQTPSLNDTQPRALDYFLLFFVLSRYTYQFFAVYQIVSQSTPAALLARGAIVLNSKAGQSGNLALGRRWGIIM
jgi:hypothetical protein